MTSDHAHIPSFNIHFFLREESTTNNKHIHRDRAPGPTYKQDKQRLRGRGMTSGVERRNAWQLSLRLWSWLSEVQLFLNCRLGALRQEKTPELTRSTHFIKFYCTTEMLDTDVMASEERRKEGKLICLRAVIQTQGKNRRVKTVP
ncbi:hypothetical protein JOB18_026654 [Solea senegalensis]|uniref:Uncharacterized protein n=1 Tax=Solea senegalensis TaxID=28829 RepID=A0AAV6RW28_SOLSE|nr:hypothetical protein JOB18_026654 [Solea senegalensis]